MTPTAIQLIVIVDYPPKLNGPGQAKIELKVLPADTEPSIDQLKVLQKLISSTLDQYIKGTPDGTKPTSDVSRN